jgi:hypothetical protein
MAAPKEKQVGKTCESNERDRASQYTRIYTKRVEALGGAWASQASLLFQIPLQASLHEIMKTHHPLAARIALLGRSATEDRCWMVGLLKSSEICLCYGHFRLQKKYDCNTRKENSKNICECQSGF